MMPVRADAVAAAVNDVAQVLAAHGDPLDLAHRLVHHCQDLLRADSVGLLLDDGTGSLHLLAASSSETRVVELYQLQQDEGPCLDAYRSGRTVDVTSRAALRERWPRFAVLAEREGISSVHTVPLLVGGRVVGALNLFRREEGGFEAVERDVAQAMASFGAVGITQLEHVAESSRVRAQLQEALDSRVLLEQAKGVLAERHGVHPDDAFARLRGEARASRRRLRDVAQEVVDRLGAGDDTPAPV